MDIVTHALVGAAVAVPCMPQQPELCAGFILGSVLPDMDAISRIFGKTQFLRWHQTYTHSLGAVFIILLFAVTALPFSSTWWCILLGVAFGMILHIALDYTNTLGVKCWLPFENRRHCREWIFFIDVPFIAMTVAPIGVTIASLVAGRFPSMGLSVAYTAAAVLYLSVKISLRKLAIHSASQHLDSNVDAMIPSAVLPWRFLGFRNLTSASQELAQIISVDLLRNRTTSEDIPIYDAAYASDLADLPGYKVMRELSPGYHIVQVEADGNKTKIVCRDLRTRNFGTEFGVLEVVLDEKSKPIQVELNV